jgi:hypothetical protein
MLCSLCRAEVRRKVIEVHAAVSQSRCEIDLLLLPARQVATMLSLGRASRTRSSPLCQACSASGVPSLKRRGLATPTSTPASSSEPQSYVEKVVQRHAVDWPASKAVRAGDFVTIRPAHVMTHDNTGPVISK